jgi:hypothetical protein
MHLLSITCGEEEMQRPRRYGLASEIRAMCRCSPTCPFGLPSNASLGAVEPSPDLAIVPESIAMLRGRRKKILADTDAPPPNTDGSAQVFV